MNGEPDSEQTVMEFVGFEEFKEHIQKLLWPGFADDLEDQLKTDLEAFARELPGSPAILRVELTERCMFDLKCKPVPGRPERFVQPYSFHCPFVLGIRMKSQIQGVDYLAIRMTYDFMDLDTDHPRYEVECALDEPIC